MSAKLEESKQETMASPSEVENSPSIRAALMILGRHANPPSQTAPLKQRLSVAFLRRKVLMSIVMENKHTEEDDDMFLSATSLRLDSCNIHAIENLEMLEKLTSVHLQNNFITTIEELDFCSKLTWLNLSKNNINTIQGLSHLKQLTCLDLSSNNITNIDSIETLLPVTSLRIFNLYGNPISISNSNTDNTDILDPDQYRTIITTKLPNLIAFDGTCLCSDPEQVVGFSPDDEIYGCDGVSCHARIIFGPRFVTGIGGKECDERDYCIRCAYTNVMQSMVHNNGQLDQHDYVLSTDVRSKFNDALATSAGGAGGTGREDPTSLLRKSAMDARIELRNQRDTMMMKIRQRRLQTKSDADKRLDLLKRLDDHLAETAEVESKMESSQTEGKSSELQVREVQEVQEIYESVGRK